ncbi:MAG: hypothetical protein ACREFE_00195 [Limisphaerales bacterium]
MYLVKSTRRRLKSRNLNLKNNFFHLSLFHFLFSVFSVFNRPPGAYCGVNAKQFFSLNLMKNYFLTAFVILTMFLPLAPIAIRADVLFGNAPDGSYGYGIYSSYPDPYVSGAAVSFTPLQNFDFSSVTLFLSNYTQPFGLQLLEGTNLDALGAIGFFSGPPPNDGSPGEFTFNLGADRTPGMLTLDTKDTYWLFAYGNYTSSGTIEWVGGMVPTGNATYNGTALYEGNPSGSFLPNLNANSPAFSINSVPEPSPGGFAMLGGAAFLLIRRRRYKHARRGENCRR